MVVKIKSSDSKEKIERTLKRLSDHVAEKRQKNFKQFFGKIKFDEDPLVLQKRWRDEW